MMSLNWWGSLGRLCLPPIVLCRLGCDLEYRCCLTVSGFTVASHIVCTLSRCAINRCKHPATHPARWSFIGGLVCDDPIISLPWWMRGGLQSCRYIDCVRVQTIDRIRMIPCRVKPVHKHKTSQLCQISIGSLLVVLTRTRTASSEGGRRSVNLHSIFVCRVL